MSIHFISDLHLNEQQPGTAEQFLQYMKHNASQCEALYILGDFFDAWPGDDFFTPFHETICQSIKALTEKGIPVFFMHGNRDFLINQRFFDASGCQALPDPFILNIHGTPTLLTHGDLLCTDDIAYQRFRRLVRHPWVLKCLRALPKFIRGYLTQTVKRQSLSDSGKKIRYVDVNLDEVHHWLKNHQVDILIHGHTHNESIHQYADKKRIVLGDWTPKTMSILTWEKNSDPKFVRTF